MTSRERRVFKILYALVVPLGVLLIDVAILVSMRAWTYNLKDNGAASFWPIVVMFGVLFLPIAVGGWAFKALGAAVVTAAIPFGAAFMMVTHRPL